MNPVLFGAVNINELNKRLKEKGEVTLRDNELGREFSADGYFELQSYPPQYEFANAPRRYYSEPTMDFDTYRQLVQAGRENEADFIIHELDIVG